jgi:hypothetical protein
MMKRAEAPTGPQQWREAQVRGMMTALALPFLLAGVHLSTPNK